MKEKTNRGFLRVNVDILAYDQEDLNAANVVISRTRHQYGDRQLNDMKLVSADKAFR